MCAFDLTVVMAACTTICVAVAMCVVCVWGSLCCNCVMVDCRTSLWHLVVAGPGTGLMRGLTHFILYYLILRWGHRRYIHKEFDYASSLLAAHGGRCVLARDLHSRIVGSMRNCVREWGGTGTSRGPFSAPRTSRLRAWPRRWAQQQQFDLI